MTGNQKYDSGPVPIQLQAIPIKVSTPCLVLCTEFWVNSLSSQHVWMFVKPKSDKMFKSNIGILYVRKGHNWWEIAFIGNPLTNCSIVKPLTYYELLHRFGKYKCIPFKWDILEQCTAIHPWIVQEERCLLLSAMPCRITFSKNMVPMGWSISQAVSTLELTILKRVISV